MTRILRRIAHHYLPFAHPNDTLSIDLFALIEGRHILFMRSGVAFCALYAVLSMATPHSPIMVGAYILLYGLSNVFSSLAIFYGVLITAFVNL